MDRIIKFRGFSIDRKNWVYGYYQYVKSNNRHLIIAEHLIDIYPDSLGEFIGLHDKNSKEIYKGDIIRILYTDWPSQSDYSISFEEYKKSISSIGSVIYNSERANYCLQFKNYTDSILEGKHGEKEVIGTVFENPELLNH
jgi:uncharacterized phage protein (TIGR01671 family)